MAVRNIGPSSWAAPASVTLTDGIQVSGSGTGSFPVNLDTLQIDYSVFDIQTIDLSSGNNTINIPISATDVKATGCYIVPPRGNAVALTLKGVAGDTGISLNPNGTNRITFATTSPPTTFVLNAGSALNGVRFVWF